MAKTDATPANPNDTEDAGTVQGNITLTDEQFQQLLERTAPARPAATSTADATPTANDLYKGKRVKVKVSPDGKGVTENTAFIHPTTKQVITAAETVSVPADDWTDNMVRQNFLDKE